jgi:hypothetical protein
MTRPLARTIICLCLLAATGCQTDAAYNVIVTNRLHETVTLWLTRAHEPYQKKWIPPEVWAIGTTGNDPVGGVVLHSGLAAQEKIEGSTDISNPAILRVYRCTNMNDILAMTLGNPSRLDYAIHPGKTDIDITLVNGELSVEPHATTHPSP